MDLVLPLCSKHTLALQVHCELGYTCNLQKVPHLFV